MENLIYKAVSSYSFSSAKTSELLYMFCMVVNILYFV